jgi:hypothetical protein
MRKLLKLLRIPALALAVMAAAAQTYNPLPDPQRRPAEVQTTAAYDAETQRVKSALGAKLISENAFDLIVLANAEQYIKEGGPGNPWKVNDGRCKTWFSPYAAEFVFVARNADKTWATVPNTDSDPGLQWTTRELQDFFKTYRSHFPQIPKFITINVPIEDAFRLQFGDGPCADFPLAKISRNADTTANFRSTFPPGVGVAVRDAELVWFKLDDYRKAFPINTTTNVPPPVAIPDTQLLFYVSQITRNGGLTPAQMVLELRKLFQ